MSAGSIHFIGCDHKDKDGPCWAQVQSKVEESRDAMQARAYAEGWRRSLSPQTGRPADLCPKHRLDKTDRRIGAPALTRGEAETLKSFRRHRESAARRLRDPDGGQP